MLLEHSCKVGPSPALQLPLQCDLLGGANHQGVSALCDKRALWGPLSKFSYFRQFLRIFERKVGSFEAKHIKKIQKPKFRKNDFLKIRKPAKKYQ